MKAAFSHIDRFDSLWPDDTGASFRRNFDQPKPKSLKTKKKNTNKAKENYTSSRCDFGVRKACNLMRHEVGVRWWACFATLTIFTFVHCSKAFSGCFVLSVHSTQRAATALGPQHREKFCRPKLPVVNSFTSVGEDWGYIIDFYRVTGWRV